MTNLSRRRFLKVTVATSAAAISSSGLNSYASQPAIWNGIVLGADASIKVYDDNNNAQSAIDTSLNIIREAETELSIYDPNSSLSQLNKAGYLQISENDGASIHRLAVQSKAIHHNTNGLFDPTIQPLFEAYAKGKGYPSKASIDKATPLVGVHKVDTSSAAHLMFKQKGMALTFNGIAQGYITDQVRQFLNKSGYEHSLINIGEYSAGASPARIGIADASGNVFDVQKISNKAIATSSPSGYRFPDGTSHILHPNGGKHVALWDTVSVIAKNAVLADGYSTALALTADRKLAEKLVLNGVLHKVVLKEINGQVHYIG